MKYKIYVLSLLFALTSCNTLADVATPTSAPIPTATLAPPTQTSTPSATPTPPDIATPETIDEGMVTYKNAEGNEVTVELGTYSYTNKKGEVLELLQSSDRLALLKSFADQSIWYPSSTDLHDAVDRSWGRDETFLELLAKYDISYPPQNRKTWLSPMPSEAGNPCMSVFQTGWGGGTLLVGQREDKSYFVRFYPSGDPNDFDDPATIDSQSAEYQYLLELAATHQ